MGGLRQRKKARTREELAAAAFRLAEERGFENVTADEIAEAAEVSRSTFFRYFPSKEAVMFTWREDMMVSFERELAHRRPGESAIGVVRRACLAVGADYQRDRRYVVRHQKLVNATPALVAYELGLDNRLEAMIADALLRLSPRAAAARRRALLLAGAVLGVLRATLREWLAGGARGDLLRRGQEALDLLENETRLGGEGVGTGAGTGRRSDR